METTLKGCELNKGYLFLCGCLGKENALQLMQHYHLGAFRHWAGATVFWQIDTRGQVRAGKIMLYDPETGKRTKKPFNHIPWVHSLLNRPSYNLRQCLFGGISCHRRLKNQWLLSRVRRRLSLSGATYPNIFGWLLDENMDVSKVAASHLCCARTLSSSLISVRLHTGKKKCR